MAKREGMGAPLRLKTSIPLSPVITKHFNKFHDVRHVVQLLMSLETLVDHFMAILIAESVVLTL